MARVGGGPARRAASARTRAASFASSSRAGALPSSTSAAISVSALPCSGSLPPLSSRRAAPRPRLEQGGAHRLSDRRGLGVDLQLLVDVAYVVAHRVDADAEVPAGRLVAASLGEQTEQLDLLGRERLLERDRRRGAAEQLHHLACDLGR